MRRHLALIVGLFFAVPTFAAEPYPFAVKVTGSGSPVILIPGLACGGAVWDSTVEWLAKDHECHVLTLAGFAGQKPVDGPFFDTMTKGVLAYVRDKKLTKTVVVGHSLGATLALKIAAEGGDKITGLVCVDGFPCIPAFFIPNPTTDVLKQLGDSERSQLEKAKGDDYLKTLKTMFSQWLAGEKLATAMKWIEASDQMTVAKSKGELFTTDLRPQAEKLGSRMLLIAAYNEGFKAIAKSADEFGGKLRTQVPKSATVTVHPNCKHFIMWDEPEWFKEKVSAFLAGK